MKIKNVNELKIFIDNFKNTYNCNCNDIIIEAYDSYGGWYSINYNISDDNGIQELFSNELRYNTRIRFIIESDYIN